MNRSSFSFSGIEQRNMAELPTEYLTVSQYHPLLCLCRAWFCRRRRPLLAGAKLPSRNASSHRSSPLASKLPNSVLHARSPYALFFPLLQPSIVLSPPGLGKQRLDQLPLLVGQQLLPIPSSLKLNKLPASRVSHCFEAEPIYETRSRQSIIAGTRSVSI